MRAAQRVPGALGAVMLLGSVLAPMPLTAQTTSGPCTVQPAMASGADACQKARDLFAFVMPQAGVALSGGNPVLGEGGTMGGWGKRAISARLTAVQGQLPRHSVPLSIAGAVGSDFGAEGTLVPVPSIDAAIGVFAGMPAGLTNIGGVDVLLGATYLPTVSEGALRFAPQSSSFAMSYGLRLGILQESSVVPGISVSAMRRKLPTVAFDYMPGNDSLNVRNLAVTANTYRLVAGKRFALFGLAAGVGRDEIESTASMQATVNETVAGIPTRTEVGLHGLRNEVSRNTAFVNVSFGLSVTRVVAEYGWSSKGTIEETVNDFGGRKANDAYRYASVGLTVRF